MIISRSNEKVKELKKLKADKKFAFLDNPKLINEAVSAGFELKYLLVNGENKPLELQHINKDCEVIELHSSIFEIFADTCNSQGVIGVIKNSNKKLAKPKSNFLILDTLQDPGNIGTLLRTALGANFLDVYLLDCVNLTNDKLIRSSMGAAFKLNVYECSKSEFVEFSKGFLKDFDIYTTEMHGENIFDIVPSKQFGIVLGNEGNGVSKEMFDLATKSISIPMANGLESLNVGVAGAIAMYQLNKKNIQIWCNHFTKYI